MKFKRLFSVGFISLCLLVLCNLSTTPSSNREESTRLNIEQTDLISTFTGNDKYLNKDLLYDVKSLEDSDRVGVIITLNERGTIDAFMEDNRGCKTMAEYQNEGYAEVMAATMRRDQNKLIDKLMREGLIDEATHSYTTLLNGFAADTNYGSFKKLQKLGIASKVSVSEVYALPEVVEAGTDDVIENETGVDESTGIFDSSEAQKAGFTGKKTAVAVLDSGFDVHHEVFKRPIVSPRFDKSYVNSLLPTMEASKTTEGLKVEDVYLNEKIPFAYDYADKDEDVAPFESEHGTHVAGIIAGDSDRITGVAVDTQLVLMKVFGDITPGAEDADIIAALEDSVTLGVDAINLSLGTACGFTTTHKEPLRNIYEKIETNGISLIVAASNDYSSGYGGEQGNSSFASNPDSAVVGSPATFNASLAVASISGVKSSYIMTEDGYKFYFEEANGNGTKPYDFLKMLDVTGSEKKQIEYVTVPGVGKDINYNAVNVRGKIALVKRGGISFEQKAEYAYNAGAIGILLYNNQGGKILMSAGSHLKIAYASITKDDGERLAQHESGMLTFSQDFKAGPYMSEFSSWGPTPDLRLKPEITAHGGEILSSVPGGGYDRISGTSMAAPNMCGIVILIRQHLIEKFPEMSHVDIARLANQILMSTATPAIDPYGNPYSPRKQGAGLGNLKSALNTNAYIIVENENNKDGVNKPKLELGDDPKRTGEKTLKFKIHNMSNTAELHYVLGNKTMTESLLQSDRRFIAEKGYMLNPSSTALVDGKPYTEGSGITVKPNSTVEVELTLKLNEEDMRYMRQGFKNGIYVEGFVTLSSMDADKIDLSVPFLGFFGDWTAAPLFDKTIFEVEKDKVNGALDEKDKTKADYYPSTPLGSYFHDFIIPIGSYIYDMDETKYQKIPTMEEHCAIGYGLEQVNGILTVYAGLLRNAKRVTTTITNSETGQVVYEHVNYDQLKAHFGGQVIPSFDLIEQRTADLGLENNVKYDFKMKAELDYGFDDVDGRNGGRDTNVRNDFEFSFYADGQAPILNDAHFYAKYDRLTKKNKYFVDLKVYDNHYAQSVRPFAIVDGQVEILSDTPIPVYGDRNGVATVTMEVTDYLDLLKYNSDQANPELNKPAMPMTNGLGILIDDYALNMNGYIVSLPGTDTPTVDFTDEFGKPTENLRLTVGEEIDLVDRMLIDDKLKSEYSKDEYEELKNEFLRHMSFVSDDENVFIAGDGKIYGVGMGHATLKVTWLQRGSQITTRSIQVSVGRSREPKAASRGINNMHSRATNRLESVDFTYFQTEFAYPDGPLFSKIGKKGDITFVTSMPKIEIYPGEQIRMNYELKPYNLQNYELEWTSSNPKAAEVNDDGLITAVGEGFTNITLKVKVDGKPSKLQAQIKIYVLSEFIVENRMLIGYKGNAKNVVIPDDLGILGIAPYAFSLYTMDLEHDNPDDDQDENKTPGSNEFIETIVIPSDIADIGKYAFANCINLRKVTLKSKMNGDTLETPKILKEGAFINCINLEEINLEHVTVAGVKAFKGCKKLNNLDFSSMYALGEEAFMGCTSLTSIDLTNVRNAGKNVFKGCTSLESFKSGEFTKYSEGMFNGAGIKEVDFYSDRIPAEAFINCSSLTRVTIHNPLIYVGKNAFSNTSGLETVEFKNSADFIYEYAFSNSNLKEVILPNSSFKMEASVFDGCKNLELIVFQANSEITEALLNLFKDNAKVRFDAENSNLYAVKDDILYNKAYDTIILASPSIKGELTIDSSVTSISSSAFNSNPNITKVTLHSGISYIGDYAFQGLANLAVVLGDSRNIVFGKGVFRDSTSLKEFEYLNELDIIYPYMFANTGFADITLNATDILEGAFQGSRNLAKVSGKAVDVEANAFNGCRMLATVNLAGLVSVGDHAFFNNSSLISFNGESLEAIGDYAFAGASLLKDITTWVNVERIGNYAFSKASGLTGSLVLPKLSYIGDFAFSSNDKKTEPNKLDTIVIDAINHIGEGAFKYNLNLVQISGNGTGELKIGKDAFRYAEQLAKVDFKNNKVHTISSGAFAECPLLTDVIINGSEIIEDGAFYNAKSLKGFDLSHVKSIGIEAFCNNDAMTKAIMPEVTVLYQGAFNNMPKLEVVTFPKLEKVYHQAITQTGVKSLELPLTLTYVAESAFGENKYLETYTINGKKEFNDNKSFIVLDGGVLYTRTANNKLTLSSYPTGKKDKVYNVLEGTVRIDYAAGFANQSIRTLVLPSTLRLIGNLAFANALLETVEFHSTVAPTLEEPFMLREVDYLPGTEMYNFLYKFTQVQKPVHNYAQFNGFIGLIPAKLNIVLPKNVSMKGYETFAYSLYFNIKDAKFTDMEFKDEFTLGFIDKLSVIPTGEVKLSDEKRIKDARFAYNLLKQNLSDFFTEAEIKEINRGLELLAQKEAELKELRLNNINFIYKDLIMDINSLGGEFNYSKISEFKRIQELLELVDEDEKRLLNLESFESFKEGYTKYFDSLQEDIKALDTITSLPTTEVNIPRVALASVTGIMGAINILGLAISKKFLI